MNNIDSDFEDVFYGAMETLIEDEYDYLEDMIKHGGFDIFEDEKQEVVKTKPVIDIAGGDDSDEESLSDESLSDESSESDNEVIDIAGGDDIDSDDESSVSDNEVIDIAGGDDSDSDDEFLTVEEFEKLKQQELNDLLRF